MSASSITPETVHLIERYHPMIYNTIAASFALIWEYSITIDVEAEFIWRSEWSWITSLFLGIRYLSLSNAIVSIIIATDIGQLSLSQEHCSGLVWFQIISVQVLLMCVELLLITRVYALYERNKVLLLTLGAIFVCASVARFSVTAIIAPGLRILPNTHKEIFPLGACFLVTIPARLYGLWIPEFIVETILFSLVIFRVVSTKLRTKNAVSNVFIVLVRDGSWAFALIFAVSLWALLEFEISRQMGAVPLTWMISLLGFCGSRLILNLRSAAGQPVVSYVETFELNSVPNPVFLGYNGSSITRGFRDWNEYDPLNRTQEAV